MRYFLSLLVLFLTFSCKSPEARKPIIKKSGHFLKESAARSKELRTQEEKQIKKVTDSDTAHVYHSSSNGFWYTYDNKNTKDTLTPHYGDLVLFTYSIEDLGGKTFYSEDEIGKREYRIDKENIFSGMREGLKLMKQGETITFYFPSYMAFGYYGDKEKIGRNMPIRSTVTLDSLIPDYDNKLQSFK